MSITHQSNWNSQIFNPIKEYWDYIHKITHAQSVIACSKLTIETLEQGVKCSELTIKTPERCQRRRSGVFIVNFEQVNADWVEFTFTLQTLIQNPFKHLRLSTKRSILDVWQGFECTSALILSFLLLVSSEQGNQNTVQGKGISFFFLLILSWQFYTVYCPQ